MNESLLAWLPRLVAVLGLIAASMTANAAETAKPEMTYAEFRAQLHGCVSQARDKSGATGQLLASIDGSLKATDIEGQDQPYTMAEREGLLAFYEASHACRRFTLDAFMVEGPMLLPMFVRHFERLDERALAILKGELSWHESMTLRQELVLRFTRERLLLGTDIAGNKAVPQANTDENMAENQRQARAAMAKDTLAGQPDHSVPPPAFKDCHWRDQTLQCEQR